MNEITQIHLGRQQFTIAVDAHRSLRTYLDQISKQVGGESDVMDEIEMRMAELLTTRGVTGEKVVLKGDVDYLREQLGEPKDFGDQTDETVAAPDDNLQRQLYRDTSDAVLGGVASGLAAYLAIPVWLVRVMFVVFALAWGSSIIVYILLWLLLPEAKTPSDRLHMQGKPVNVDTLRNFVAQTPLRENAKEIGDKAEAVVTTTGPVLLRWGQKLFDVARVVIGAVLLILGVTGMIYVIGMGSYVLANPDKLFEVGRLFPVGATETALLVLAFVAAELVALLVAVVGLGFVKRRWPLPVWLTAGIISLLLAAVAIGIPAGVAVAPHVADRYNATAWHDTVSTTSYTSLGTLNLPERTRLEYEVAPAYDVTFMGHGQYDKSQLKATVTDGKLSIDAGNYRDATKCSDLCIRTDNLTVIVHAPQVPTNFDQYIPRVGEAFVPDGPDMPMYRYRSNASTW